MGMKFSSGHFSGTNGTRKMSIPLNIQLFASKFKAPTETNKIKLNVELQNKHIMGTKENAMSQNKSLIAISASECASLVKEYHGKGTMINSHKEEVNFGKIIGFVYCAEKRRIIPTTWGSIHYGKTGSHIVPKYKKGE